MSSILLLIALAVRAFFLQTNVIEEERKWFVGQLNYNCSITVDTVSVYGYRGEGFLFCTLVSGKPDISIEKGLRENLKYYKSLFFLRETKNHKYLITTPKADKFQKEDSLLINSAKNQILVFRNKKILFEELISNSMMTELF